MADNPVLTTALQVLDSLSDVGKALPFIAPAFVLLKVIIDIETRAQEVDVKCNDLLERVTFMVSHLPIIEKSIEVPASTRLVIDRVTESLKQAASLIAAYRKQSKIARRLSLTNRDKFTQIADQVNACCEDLLMSLQIHQSTQLEVLVKRGVPMDEEDEAARTFIADHGSIEAIVHDRELVKEFAQQQHLVMDDSVMEQLNASIADSVQENHLRLEGILKENVAKAIESGLKNLVMTLNASESEQTFVCVQCENSFTNNTNGPKACSFHKGDYNSWSKSYPCCGTQHPCQFQAHRAKHHCDYPYGKFFPRAYAITGYTDTQDVWASATDTNLETDEEQTASVGQLYRWVSRGARIDENTILISVGRIRYNSPYYFNTFTAKELEEITKSVRLSRRTLIFRTPPPPPPAATPKAKVDPDSEYAMAEWILSISGKITGVRLIAKAATSNHPWIKICPIDLSTASKSGEVIVASEGGLRSYVPSPPGYTYTLPSPNPVRVGPEMDDKPARAVRTNFKTRIPNPSSNLRVVLKAVNDPPLEANPNLASPVQDYFEGTISVFNNHQPGSLNPLTIAAVSAEYRYIGEKEYKPVPSGAGGTPGCAVLNGVQLPITIDVRQSAQVKVQVTIPRTEEDAKMRVQWWNRAFCARKRPLRIRVMLEDIEGETCSLVMEYVFKAWPLDKQKDEDLGFFYIDNPVSLSRHSVRVEKSSWGDSVLKIGSNDISSTTLIKTVYKALKTGKTEVDMEIGQEKDDGEWEWNAWALVDISCRKVYAFKVLIQQGKKVPDDKKHFACLGYALCPDYGEPAKDDKGNPKTRPPSYVTEVVKIPSGLVPFVAEEYEQDDTVDDFKPPVPPKPSTSLPGLSTSLLSPVDGGVGGGGMMSVPPELTNRLASIDSNLSRIATALESLLGVMGARQN